MAARTVVARGRVGPGGRKSRGRVAARRGRLAKGEGASGASESPTRGTTLAPACSVAAPGAESRFRESPPVWAESPVCKAQSPFGKGPSRPSRGLSRPSCVVPVAPFVRSPRGTASRSQWERETNNRVVFFLVAARRTAALQRTECAPDRPMFRGALSFFVNCRCLPPAAEREGNLYLFPAPQCPRRVTT